MPRATLPATGRGHDELLSHLDAIREGDADWRGGRTWSLIYPAGEAHHAFLQRAHNRFFAENALNPMAFRSLKRLEAEVVQMTAAMLHGDERAVGVMTSGGTESLLVAVLAYREHARARWPWIRRPNVVLPRTAHPAFEKAAHLFGVRLRFVPCDEHGRVDVRAYRRRIDRNTILCAASAPQYVTGAVDPIPELSELARRRGLPFHVDACFGGFILPWLERLGRDLPAWDLRNPGVTSVSADVHKYGYAPKGASVIVYRGMEHLKHQFFVSTGWPGGIYASPSLPGTRPGGPIAAAWASMMAMGEQGYTALAADALRVADRLRDGISAIPGLRLLGDQALTVVTWASADLAVDTYAVADQLAARGWEVSRQQSPPSVHCSTNASNLPAVEAYLADLRAAVEHARAHPELASQGEAAMYGMMAKVPVRGLVARGVRQVMEQLYGPDGEVPDLADASEDPAAAAVRRYVLPALDRVDEARARLRRAARRMSRPAGMRP